MIADRFEVKGRHIGLVAAGLVLLGALAPLSPLQDAATGASVGVAVKTEPLAWIAFAPLFAVWDTLSLLTLSQHYAVLVTLVALYISGRTRARRRAREAGGMSPDGAPGAGWGARLGQAITRETLRAGAAVLLLLSFYAAGMLLPRPMTGVEILDSDLVAIDFHSHTEYSHDGWKIGRAHV